MEKVSRRYWILKDSRVIGETGNYRDAVKLVRAHQEHETHYMLRSDYMIIDVAAQEFVKYKK